MLRESPRRVQRAFTLFELMIVVAIAAVLATMVLPMIRNDERLQLIAAASLVTSDIEYAQSLSISRPSSPAAVSFDTSTASYHVAYQSSVETPLTRDDTGESYAVTFGTGRATGAAGVTMSVKDMNKNLIQFDSHGGLLEFNATPVITLQAGNEWFQLTISPTTGTITETSGAGTPP